MRNYLHMGITAGYSGVILVFNLWVIFSMQSFLVCLTGLWLIVNSVALAAGATQRSLELPSGHEVIAEVYGHSSEIRVLWISPSYGLNARHRQVAKDLASQGLQVWQTDLTEALFLPRGAQAMREIPAGVMAEMIQAVSENGKYKLLLISGSYGAIPTLRGVHAWQGLSPKQHSLLGVVLFSPYLFTHVPTLGEAPEFVDVTSATSVPIYIFQAAKHSNRWHHPAMVKQLESHAPVYTEIMPGVTSLFYEKDQALPTLNRLKMLADRISKIIPLLKSHSYPLSAVPLSPSKTTENKLGLDDRLKPYRGRVQAQAFSLKDVNGKSYSETDFKGKVSVINFWATWCPPCVEEIPSLNRLRQKMKGKAFQLISINYAESAERIKSFMQKVAVDFPVLLDPQGKTAGHWKVVVFPSTFVIGPDGRIRYGVNSAIHWDTDEVVRDMNALLEPAIKP